MTSLSDLANLYNTDKRESDHNYVNFYEQLMGKNRFNRTNLLEVGFGGGGSARTWLEYFPNSSIYCIEYMEDEHREVWMSPSLDVPNLKVIIGDSTKEETWRKIPYNFDYLIDDGDHHPHSQIKTFELGFPHLKSGGYYVIEDTHTNFEQRYTGGIDIIYKWVFDMIIRQQTPGYNYGGDFYKCRHAIDGFAKDIYGYSFYKSLVVFQKA